MSTKFTNWAKLLIDVLIIVPVVKAANVKSISKSRLNYKKHAWQERPSTCTQKETLWIKLTTNYFQKIPAHSSLKKPSEVISGLLFAGWVMTSCSTHSFDFSTVDDNGLVLQKITIKDCSRVCGQPKKQLCKTKGIKSTKPKHSINSLTWWWRWNFISMCWFGSR